jgi:GNAT superfamily N-acetyltransferase
MVEAQAVEELVIRRAERSDAAALAELAGELGYPTEPAEMERRLAALPRGDDVWVAVLDGRVVGWAHCTVRRSLLIEPHIEVMGLVVGEPWHGRGVGRHLMAAAEQSARAAGVGSIRLRSGVQREGAHAFYLGLGYREQKRQAVFVRDMKA